MLYIYKFYSLIEYIYIQNEEKKKEEIKSSLKWKKKKNKRHFELLYI
jgi:hypothetical protein